MPEFQEVTLDNGLKIIAETDPSAHTAAVGFFVKTGARDEETPLMGVSHFLEHMLFKGTSRRSAADVNREFDEIGANYNAYTSNEMTCFYASTLPEMRTRATDVLADIMRPALREDDFATEKHVILEEIAMYGDVPFWKLYEATMERYYGEHPLSHRVLGTNESITALEAARMREYFDRRYAPDNMVVSMAGRLDFDEAVKQIDELCGGWASTGAVRTHGEPRPADVDFTLRDPRVARGYLLMVAPAPAYEDERRYAAMLLMRILGQPDNSRLHWALLDTGIAEEAASDYDGRDGCGDYYIYASGEPTRLEEIETIVKREVASLADSVTEDDLELLRSKLATQVTLAGERPGGRMQRLGRNWTYLGRYATLEEELALINAVTVEQLRELARAYPFDPMATGRLLPEA